MNHTLKTLLISSVSTALIALGGALSQQSDPWPDTRPGAARPAVSIINHGANTVWDKKFDRYSAYWMGRFSRPSQPPPSIKLPDQIRQANTLRIHQANAWADPDNYRKKETANITEDQEAGMNRAGYDAP